MATNMKHIIKETVQETVREMLLSMGIDTSSPDGMLAYQQDMHYLRSTRLRSENLENKAWNQGLVMVLTAIGATIIMGVVAFFRGH